MLALFAVLWIARLDGASLLLNAALAALIVGDVQAHSIDTLQTTEQAVLEQLPRIYDQDVWPVLAIPMCDWTQRKTAGTTHTRTASNIRWDSWATYWTFLTNQNDYVRYNFTAPFDGNYRVSGVSFRFTDQGIITVKINGVVKDTDDGYGVSRHSREFRADLGALNAGEEYEIEFSNPTTSVVPPNPTTTYFVRMRPPYLYLSLYS